MAVLCHMRVLKALDGCSMSYACPQGPVDWDFRKGPTPFRPCPVCAKACPPPQVVKTANAYADPRFNSDIDKVTGYRTESLLCMPVSYEGQVVAVAQLINKLSPEGKVVEYLKEDIGIFASFAVHAAVFLRSARLHNEAVKQRDMAETSYHLVNTLSEAVLCDLDQLTELLIKEAAAMAGPLHCGVFRVNQKTGALGAAVGDLVEPLLSTVDSPPESL